MGEILAKIFWVFGLLLPPRLSRDERLTLDEKMELYEYHGKRWRWVVFYTLTALMAVVSINLAATWGYEPYFHGLVKQTAYMAQQEDTKAALASNELQLVKIQIHQLEESLVATRIGQCKSTDKRYFTGRLQELMQQYRDMTKSEWRVPACGEVESVE